MTNGKLLRLLPFVTLAIVLSIVALVIQFAQRPFAPLSDVTVSIEGDTVSPLEPAHILLNGCIGSDTVLLLYTLWISDDNRTVLGPATATEVEEGCVNAEVDITVPALERGEWRLSLVAIATGRGKSQTVTALSNPVRVD